MPSSTVYADPDEIRRTLCAVAKRLCTTKAITITASVCYSGLPAETTNFGGDVAWTGKR